MPSAARERELNDRLWERVAPLLPPRPPHPKGGRPFADDRSCFEGVVYVLRNGLRWRAMPACYPSAVTCWRRHRDWTRAGVWDDAWKLILRELAEAGRLKADELVLDGTYVEAKRGAPGSARAGSATGRRSRSSPTAGAPPSGRRRTGPMSTR
jgi:transposase